MTTTQPVSSLERAYAYLITEPSPGSNPVTTEDLARFVGAEDVARVVDKVYEGRAARELVRKTEVREKSLRTFCENTIFYSYLPEEARTESLGKIFDSKNLALDPETKIAMYEKWLAELPYHQFTHLTSMTVYPKIERGHIFSMPPEIAKFSHLTKLSFSGWLPSLPEELKRLPSLRILDLRLYSGGYGDLENFKEICRALPHLDTIIFSSGEQGAEVITRFPTACIEMLRNEFPNIKIEFGTIPKASWHPC